MKKISARYIAVYCVCILAFGLLLRSYIVRSPGLAEKMASYAVYPFIRSYGYVVTPLCQWQAKKRTMRDLEEHISQLQGDRDAYLEEVLRLRAQLDQGAVYRDATDDKAIARATVAVAQIITRHCSPQAHYFIIDAGTQKQVKPGMVVTYKRVLLGRITESYPWYSKVIALTDQHCRVTTISSETKTLGIHEGMCDHSLTKLKFVSHLQPIKIGETLVSSGEGLVFPRGLGVGVIVSCSQQELYHDIEVKPLLDMRTVSYCTVIDKARFHEDMVIPTVPIEATQEPTQEPGHAQVIEQ